MGIASGRAALVAGGASGFGLEIARRLRGAGARLAILDLPGARLEAAAAEVDATPCAADVRHPAAVREAVEAAATAMDGLDTLVYSAGVIHIKALDDVTPEDWDLTLDVNLRGAFLVCQAAAPHLRRSGRGRIVTIASDAGRRGFSWIQAYTASKFGLVGLTESLAVELAEHGVTVNCVCPVGCPTTAMGQEVLDWKVRTVGRSPDEVMAAAARTNPLGRNATEADVASAVCFFLTDEADFLTGVALDVDGGAHLGFMPGT